MRRRDFVAGIMAAATVPLPAVAQKIPVVGFLSAQSRDSYAPFAAAFRQGLQEAGYSEGRNVAIEYRWAEGLGDRLPALAAELVDRKVAVIAATGGVPSVLAAKAATTTIPIVFNSGEDPVEAGLVTSLSHPGGNLTGVSWFSTALAGKLVQLLLQMAPRAKTIGLVVDPKSPESLTQPQSAEAAAKDAGRPLVVAKAATPEELDTVFPALAKEGADALVVGAGAFLVSRRAQIIGLAAHYRLPTIYVYPQAARDGGLISYGNELTDAYRRNARYVGRILNGDKPGDLPIDRSTKFDLVINLKTANALGLTVPQSLLAGADDVIE